MAAVYSRRTVLAAIDVLDCWNHAQFTEFLVELGPAIYPHIRDEATSLKKRLSDLKIFFDRNPGFVVDGTPLEDVFIERAVAMLPPEPKQTFEWSRGPRRTDYMEAFLRALERDGFVVSEGALRRALPTEIGLPDAESELVRLLDKHGFEIAKSHLNQAVDAHARANWAGANGQIRTFIDALLDTIAERIDAANAVLSTGQPRRIKLAQANFLSTALNEWNDQGTGYFNGLIRRLHPEGPHPGLSDEDDSTYRLHVVLLTAKLLMRRFDRGPA
ncbi:hypothetical protein WBQ88_05435 [Sphingopyxis sp. CCNWLW253]|uniref:hypothetical protein n=1 Tax=unclassified Sphingopyxis TaxID=2614943 RepID=UPI003012B58A